MKKWYASKMFWFNVLAFVVAVAAGFGYTGEMSADLGAFVFPAIAIINIILRFITSKAIG